ncbi:hypothetical protein [Flavobacterium sp.]|uniref:hypothetical protein n=1 Tax=Flavobacterium sp. TaxID=239 RepID=UPI004048A4FA
MKLTEEQIAHIEDFINKSNIKYYEVYMEILDHMILSVEDILDKEDITFEEAILKAKKEGFGKKSFNTLMNEKQKLAQQKASKNNLIKVKEYFTFPKITLTACVFVAYYIFSSFFENPTKIGITAVLLISFASVFQLLYSWKFRKINNFHILKTHTLFNLFNFPLIGIHITQAIINLGKDSIDFNHIIMRFFMSFVFTFSFISLLVFIEVRKKTIAELKKEIFI